MSDIFKTLNAINVNNNTEKKGRFTYLSWAWAWAELMKAYPTATRTVYENAEGLPCFIGLNSVIVKVGVTINGIEHIQHHPVFDSRNKAIPADKCNLMDVNTAIQRATVKAIGLHGLGLYIYAGEDLPEGEDAPRQQQSRPQQQHQRQQETNTNNNNGGGGYAERLEKLLPRLKDGSWIHEFCVDRMSKHEQYGDKVRWSEKQVAILEKAERDHPVFEPPV